MEKPSKVQFQGKSSLKPVIDETKEPLYNINTVSIRCLVDAIVKVTGTVTKNVYVFQGGNPVDIDVRDKDEIINKKRGRSCCGGNSNRYLFELV